MEDGRVLEVFIELEFVLLSASNDETRTRRFALDVIRQFRDLEDRRLFVVTGMNCYIRQLVVEDVGICQVESNRLIKFFPRNRNTKAVYHPNGRQVKFRVRPIFDPYLGKKIPI